MKTLTRQGLTAILAALVLLPALLSASTLYRGNGAEPSTLDVHKSSGVPEANIQRDLFEGLVTEAADGSLQPGVAERWDISDDGLRYTFHLRQNSKWSNGEPVTAADFVYAFQRALKPETASDYAFILWAISGAEALSKSEGSANENELAVVAKDTQTLEITLTAPTPYFLELLTHHMAYPVSKTVIEAEGKRWTRPGKMVSNGAYQLAEWQPQSHIKLVKNPHYRRAAEIHLDEIVYIPTEDKSSELKRFRAGELHITDTVPIDQIAWVKENLPAAYRNTPYIGTYYYAFNLAKPPFKGNPDLRRALALALDRSILTGKISRAGESPAFGWLPPGMNGYEQQRMPEAELSQKERRSHAQALYAKAGYSKSHPLEIELLYNTSDNHKKLAIAVAAMWKQVLGVKTTLRNEEWKVYLNSRKQGDFQVVRAGWIGDYNDANTFLSLFKSDVGEMNTPAYRSDVYDEAVKQAESEQDKQKRAALLQAAERRLLADMPVIPVYHYNSQHLVNPKLKGWVDNVMDVHPSQYLSLEADQ